MVKARDYTGEKYGKLTAIKVSEKRTPRGTKLWEFICECGKPHIADMADVKRSKTVGCKDCNREQLALRYRTHGKSGGKSKAYLAWKRIKMRCYNPKERSYDFYNNLGMDTKYINDSIAFMEHVGEPPDDGKRHSIDRIDNNIGYFEGNMRWATDHQQAANQGKRKDNKTGVTGVEIKCSGIPTHTPSYISTWRDIKTGKQHHKSFNVGKLGEELAFFMACEYRELMIQRMNDLGAQYTPTHGL